MGFVRVKVCIVCKKTSGNQIVDWDKTAHRFPNDPELRKKWFEVLGLDEATTPKHATVCYKHFSRDQRSTNNRLKRTAVPNRNLDVKKGEEVKVKPKKVHGLASIQPKAPTVKTVTYFEPSFILGSIKQVPLGVPIPAAPSPVSIVTPASPQTQLQIIQQMLSGTILSNSSFAGPGGVSLNGPEPNSAPSTSVSQPPTNSTISSNDGATVTQIISPVSSSDATALPSPNVENSEIEVIVLDDEDEDENICRSKAVKNSGNQVDLETEIVPKSELLLEDEEEEEEEEELVGEDLVKLEESDKKEDEGGDPLECDAGVGDVDPLSETSGASSASTSLRSATTSITPPALETTLPPKPNLPPVPGVFLIVEGQVYQVASAGSPPTPVSNQKTVETVAPSKKRATSIKCPFGCRKRALSFSLLKIDSLTRFCNHLDSCSSLKKKTAQNTDSKETLFFLHCPNCKDYIASLDSREEKRSFVEHIGWCAENRGKMTTGIPLKFRLFQCSLCSKKKYMNLEQYQKHCFRHSLRQNLSYKVPWWCPWCNERFQNEQLREDHLKMKHSTQWEQCQGQRLQCQWCTMKYLSQEELNLHQATGHITEKFGIICDQPPCSKTFLSEKRYKLHRRLEHKVDLFKCVSCDQEFVSEINYEKHLQKHAGNDVLKCSKCDEQFEGKGAVRRLWKHMLSHQDSWVKCNLCGKQLCKQALQRHMIFVHKTRPRRYQCPHEDCDKAYHDKGTYQDHLSKHRGEKRHMCRFCSKTFFFRYALSFHERIHKNLEASLHKCEICKRGFTTLRGLRFHDQRVHGENPAPKVEPKKNETAKTDFPKPHLKREVTLPSPETETPPPFYVCDQCGKRYKTKVNLYTHYQVHHLKRYQCTCHVCGMKLLKSYHLRLHLSRVHGVGTYGQNKCPVESCGKVFYAPSLLQHHMTLHNGQGPQFSCDQCGKAFVFPRHLTLHLRTHSERT